MQRRVIVSTAATDARRTLVGSSPVLGDATATGIVLPPFATSHQSGRTMVRLATVDVPDRHVARVLDIGQLLTLAACWAVDPEQLPATDPIPQGAESMAFPSFHAERPVVTPWWSFSDGNVSWHLRVFSTTRMQSDIDSSTATDGFSPGLYGTGGPAIMYRPDSPPLPFPVSAIVPPGDGALPGVPFGDLGVWRDTRYHWDRDCSAQVPDLVAKGPCVIAMYASVHQTNPALRLRPAAWMDPAMVQSLVPEDQFLISFPNTARYYRIAGRMTVDVRPDCEE